MKTSYFVAVDGITIAKNLTKEDAVKIATETHLNNQKLGGLQIGIGRVKRIDGLDMYFMHPYFLYTN